MNRTFQYMLAVLLLSVVSAFAAEEESPGLLAAKRVVKTHVAKQEAARAYGWGRWMVKKYKKSARYQVKTEKTVIQN